MVVASFKINNPNDDLCFACTVVVAKACIDKEMNPEIEWGTIRKGDSGCQTPQKRKAQELMNLAGLTAHTGTSLFCIFKKR